MSVPLAATVYVDPKTHRGDPVPIHLMAVEVNRGIAPFPGNGTLTISSTKASVYSDAACQNAIIPAGSTQATIANASIINNQSHVVYLKGEDVGNVTLKFELDPAPDR